MGDIGYFGIPEHKDGRQYWRYAFNDLKNHSGTTVIYAYAFSEKEARDGLAVTFGADNIGDMIERKPW